MTNTVINPMRSTVRAYDQLLQSAEVPHGCMLPSTGNEDHPSIKDLGHLAYCAQRAKNAADGQRMADAVRHYCNDWRYTSSKTNNMQWTVSHLTHSLIQCKVPHAPAHLLVNVARDVRQTLQQWEAKNWPSNSVPTVQTTGTVASLAGTGAQQDNKGHERYLSYEFLQQFQPTILPDSQTVCKTVSSLHHLSRLDRYAYCALRKFNAKHRPTLVSDAVRDFCDDDWLHSKNMEEYMWSVELHVSGLNKQSDQRPFRAVAEALLKMETQGWSSPDVATHRQLGDGLEPPADVMSSD